MVNLAIALAFGMSFIFSPGKLIINETIGMPLLQSLPSYQGHIILAFLNYWMPAALIYLILRIIRAEKWVRLSTSSSIFLTISNILFVLYIAARTFASTIQGGGASFVVMSYSPFVIYPAIAMLLIGLCLLAIYSFRHADESSDEEVIQFNAREGIIVSAFILLPIAFAAINLYFLPNAPFRLAHEGDKTFDEYCKNSGEKIYEIPQYVESVYLEPDSASQFNKIKNGVYGGHGSGILGGSLVNSGMLLYFEKKNDANLKDANAPKYTKHILQDWKGEPVNEISSEYAVIQTKLVSEEEQTNLKISGTEVSVKNLKTGKVMATLVYFTNSSNRRICGQSSDGDFTVNSFVWRALNLKKQFPNALRK